MLLKKSIGFRRVGAGRQSTTFVLAKKKGTAEPPPLVYSWFLYILPNIVALDPFSPSVVVAKGIERLLQGSKYDQKLLQNANFVTPGE